MKEQLGRGSIQVTVDTDGHLIPGANRAAVDRLDDDVSTQPDATQAQPASVDDAGTLAEMKELFSKSGEPDFTSWNQMAAWLRQIEGLRRAW